MTHVLIDTDVVLDFFFDRQPFSENAAKVLSLCELKKINGYVTPVILSNCYYILRQHSKHEKVIEKLTALVSILDILSVEKESVLRALRSDFKDFEDALQNYSAEEHGKITTIITRNIKDYKKSNLGVMLPDEYLKIQIS